MSEERKYPESIEFSNLRSEHHLRTRRGMRSVNLRFIPDGMLDAMISEQGEIDTSKPVRVLLDKDNNFIGLDETRRDQGSSSS